MNEWARLVDKYGSELKKFDLICSLLYVARNDDFLESRVLLL